MEKKKEDTLAKLPAFRPSAGLAPAITLIAALACVSFWTWGPTLSFPIHNVSNSLLKCPQISPIPLPYTTPKLDSMEAFLQSGLFRNQSIGRLSGAVQIPTESFDDIGTVCEDPRWDVFFPFAVYLEKTFPLVHSTLALEKINTHGLLYTWKGSDPSLKPTLLMAHQDTVPVPNTTLHQWTYPPFSGHYDGRYVWGRGASDCKNQLIAILSAVEALISASFSPNRTLILSFGFDEEISGQDGAAHLATHLLSQYGNHSMAVILDEGAGTAKMWGSRYAMPGVAEKGYVDVDVVVRMAGGHSSIPPKHNAIGVASEIVREVEQNLYEPRLDEENPYLGLLECGREHSPEFPPKLKELLERRREESSQKIWPGKPFFSGRRTYDELAHEASKLGPETKYLMTTSVAVDLISGGIKINALPERVSLTINHRINVGSNSRTILDHVTSLIKPVAQKYHLAFSPFNASESESSITLSYRDTLLEPAPVTPTTLYSNSSLTPYAILSSTTRAIYNNSLLVTPGIMTGNTDTRYYWKLSPNIFRYGPGWDGVEEGLGNIHTVDEKVSVNGHVKGVQWFFRFIRSMDGLED